MLRACVAIAITNLEEIKSPGNVDMIKCTLKGFVRIAT